MLGFLLVMIGENSQAREKQEADGQEHADYDVEGGVVRLITLISLQRSRGGHLVTAVPAPLVSAASLSVITREVLSAGVPPGVIIDLAVTNHGTHFYTWTDIL